MEKPFMPMRLHVKSTGQSCIIGLEKMSESKIFLKVDALFLGHENGYFASNQAPEKSPDFAEESNCRASSRS